MDARRNFRDGRSPAEALALDVSAELTAPVSIYLKMRRELAAIRAVVPDAFPVSPRFEWAIPNGLWVTVTPNNLTRSMPVTWDRSITSGTGRTKLLLRG